MKKKKDNVNIRKENFDFKLIFRLLGDKGVYWTFYRRSKGWNRLILHCNFLNF